METHSTQAQHDGRRPGRPLNREAVTEILQGFLAELPEVVAGYLFGSVARDRAIAGSDVDVALLLDASYDVAAHPLYRLERMTDLEALLGCPVDVVILNEAPLVLRNQVLTYGRRIHETDHRQRVEYEVRSRQAYWDFRPILDCIYAAQRRHIKEGVYGRVRLRYNTEVIETRLAMLSGHVNDLRAIRSTTFEQYVDHRILRGTPAPRSAVLGVSAHL